MKLLKYFLQNCIPEWWNIGFIFNFDADVIIKSGVLNIQWIKQTYKDRWFADPFILNISEHDIMVLVEEFCISTQKGRIAKLTIDKESLTIKSNATVLELPSHLSFPAILRDKENIYVYPENSSDKRVIMYRYDEEKEQMKAVSLLSPEPLTDAVINMGFGAPFLFSTKLPQPNGNTLYIYKAKAWNGNYELAQTIEFHDNIARNSGDLLRTNDKWIRPAQDCNGEYGKGIVFQEVLYEDNTFSFKELCRFYPTSKKWNVGIHTLNVHNNIAVVDGKRYKNAPLRKLYLYMNNFRKKFMAKAGKKV
jgi:hypothetical protein